MLGSYRRNLGRDDGGMDQVMAVGMVRNNWVQDVF